MKFPERFPGISRIFIFCSDLDPDLPIDIVHLRDHLVASVIFLTQFKMASSSSSCSGNLVETSLASFSSFACSDDSSCGHGACNEDSECVCNPPWTGEFFEFLKRIRMKSWRTSNWDVGGTCGLDPRCENGYKIFFYIHVAFYLGRSPSFF